MARKPAKPARRGKRKVYNLHVTDEKVEAALRATAGIYRYAAEQLKCAPNTVKNRVTASAHLQAVLLEIADDLGDLVEHKFIEKIKRGNMTAMIFYAKCKLKHRGWVERTELTGPNGGNLSISLREIDEFDKALEANQNGGPPASTAP